MFAMAERRALAAPPPARRGALIWFVLTMAGCAPGAGLPSRAASQARGAGCAGCLNVCIVLNAARVSCCRIHVIMPAWTGNRTVSAQCLHRRVRTVTVALERDQAPTEHVGSRPGSSARPGPPRVSAFDPVQPRPAGRRPAAHSIRSSRVTRPGILSRSSHVGSGHPSPSGRTGQTRMNLQTSWRFMMSAYISVCYGEWSVGHSTGEQQQQPGESAV